MLKGKEWLWSDKNGRTLCLGPRASGTVDTFGEHFLKLLSGVRCSPSSTSYGLRRGRGLGRRQWLAYRRYYS